MALALAVALALASACQRRPPPPLASLGTRTHVCPWPCACRPRDLSTAVSITLFSIAIIIVISSSSSSSKTATPHHSAQTAPSTLLKSLIKKIRWPPVFALKRTRRLAIKTTRTPKPDMLCTEHGGATRNILATPHALLPATCTCVCVYVRVYARLPPHKLTPPPARHMAALT